MDASGQRSDVLERLMRIVLDLRLPHPTRVAIEGRSAAGKTTFADELAELVRAGGREVLRASIDDFHRPGHKYRSQRGEWTPRSYCEEGYDYEAFRDVLLRPLAPGGDRRCRTGIFDSFHDTWLPEEWHQVARDAVVLVDGAFLLRPELVASWDYIVWLDIDWETMLERARRRDVAWVGSEQLVLDRYRNHWIPTHQLYERDSSAREHAHAIVDNRNIDEPTILRLLDPTPRLSIG